MNFVMAFLLSILPSAVFANSECSIAQEFRIYREDTFQSEVLFVNHQDSQSARCLEKSSDGHMTKVSVNGVTGWVFNIGIIENQIQGFENSVETISDESQDVLDSQSAYDIEAGQDSDNELASPGGSVGISPRFKPMTVKPRFKPQLPLIPADDSVDETAQSNDLVYDQCFTKNLLRSAKRNVRRNHNHFGSWGYCGRAVAQSIKRAGVNVQVGNGIDYYRPSGRSQPRGHLERAGFVNYYQAIANKIRSKGRKVNQRRLIAEAPPGAVLVFKGPESQTYWRTGHIGRPAGDFVGHVTIKGNDGLFYTDGKTRRAAIKNRQLVGIYLMKDCSHCSKKAKQKSEAACGK